MEIRRTESEIRENCKKFSITDLKFAIKVNNFLKFFCTDWGLFLLYFVITSIPMFIFYEKVLERPLFYGVIFKLVASTMPEEILKITESHTRN